MQNIDNKIKLNIITVTYNEEANLPKFFQGIKNLEEYFDTHIIIVDQSSIDNSVEIIKQQGGTELYLHENKGYADPDKKRIFDNCITAEDERCFILDADDEITGDIAKNLAHIILNNKVNCIKIKIDPIFFDTSCGASYQNRIFTKQGMHLSDEIHNYMHPTENAIYFTMKDRIISDDLKFSKDPFGIFITKFNKYSEIDAEQMHKNGVKSFLYIRMYRNIFQGFIYYYFRHGLILHGRKGFNNAIFFCTYIYFKYCKLIAIYNRKSKKGL